MLKSGMLHSLVVRFVRDEEVMGSNPVIPTIRSIAHISHNNAAYELFFSFLAQQGKKTNDSTQPNI